MGWSVLVLEKAYLDVSLGRNGRHGKGLCCTGSRWKEILGGGEK